MHIETSLSVTLSFPLPLEYFSPYSADKILFPLMLDHLAFDTAIFVLLPVNQASAQMLLSEMSFLATQL